MNFFEIILNSFELIYSLDVDLYNIIFLSLRVSLIALLLSSILALILGYILAVKDIFFKNIVLIFLNAFMGTPPVVVGLLVYFLLARGGPFGILDLLYTPYAMIFAQSIIIFPIVSSLSYEVFSQKSKEFTDHFRAFNIPFFIRAIIIIRHSYFIIITIVFSGFGRAISEVGAVMIVGGNIENYTRVMTSSIALETRMGNLNYAMALGIVLIIITIFINAFIYLIKFNKRLI